MLALPTPVTILGTYWLIVLDDDDTDSLLYSAMLTHRYYLLLFAMWLSVVYTVSGS